LTKIDLLTSAADLDHGGYRLAAFSGNKETDAILMAEAGAMGALETHVAVVVGETAGRQWQPATTGNKDYDARPGIAL
jgi:hypothetical protein